MPQPIPLGPAMCPQPQDLPTTFLLPQQGHDLSAMCKRVELGQAALFGITDPGLMITLAAVSSDCAEIKS